MRTAVPPAKAGRRAASQCVTNDGSSLYTIGYCSVTLPINKLKGRVNATRPFYWEKQTLCMAQNVLHGVYFHVV